MSEIAQIKLNCIVPPMAFGEESTEAIGRRLELTRIALGIGSQAAMAAQLGADPGKWNNYVRGRHKIAHDLAVEMCRRWGLTLDWIFLGIPPHNPELASRLRDAADKLDEEMAGPRPGRPRKTSL